MTGASAADFAGAPAGERALATVRHTGGNRQRRAVPRVGCRELRDRRDHSDGWLGRQRHNLKDAPPRRTEPGAYCPAQGRPKPGAPSGGRRAAPRGRPLSAFAHQPRRRGAECRACRRATTARRPTQCAASPSAPAAIENPSHERLQQCPAPRKMPRLATAVAMPECSAPGLTSFADRPRQRKSGNHQSRQQRPRQRDGQRPLHVATTTAARTAHIAACTHGIRARRRPADRTARRSPASRRRHPATASSRALQRSRADMPVNVDEKGYGHNPANAR